MLDTSLPACASEIALEDGSVNELLDVTVHVTRLSQARDGRQSDDAP